MSRKEKRGNWRTDDVRFSRDALAGGDQNRR